MKASVCVSQGEAPAVPAIPSHVRNDSIPVASTRSGDLPAVVEEGEIVVTRQTPGQLIVVFNSWRGKTWEGFLYAAKTLTQMDLGNDEGGHPIFSLGSFKFILEQQLDSNWYKVRQMLA